MIAPWPLAFVTLSTWKANIRRRLKEESAWWLLNEMLIIFFFCKSHLSLFWSSNKFLKMFYGVSHSIYILVQHRTAFKNISREIHTNLNSAYHGNIPCWHLLPFLCLLYQKAVKYSEVSCKHIFIFIRKRNVVFKERYRQINIQQKSQKDIQFNRQVLVFQGEKKEKK